MSIVSIEDYKSRTSAPKGIRALVVDDQSTPRLILQRMLESSGYSVVAVASGKEALEELKTGSFTLVLLDFIMPEMSGMEVLAKIRENFSQTQLPVIMVSMSSDSEGIVRALSLGANDYIVKPFDYKILKARIDIQIDLKLKDDALRQKEEQFRLIFENAPIGMGLGDKSGTILSVNRAACDMVGYTAQELIGRNFREFTHPDEQEISEQHLKRLFTGEIRHYRLEKRYRHRDGHYIWVEMSVSALPGNNGKPTYLVEQAQDISERKQAAEELARHRSELEQLVRERTEKLSSANASLEREIEVHSQTEETLRKREMQLLEAQHIAHLGFWERDLETEQLYWSDEIYNILGIDRKNFTPRPGVIDEFVHPDDAEEFRSIREAARQGGLPFNHEFRIIRPDGEIRKLHGRSKLILDADRNPKRFMGTIIDITETSQMSDQLNFQLSHDPMTGLVNRKMFEELLRDTLTLRRIISHDFEHILCYLSVDQLKVINDTYGHIAGDELLCQLSQLLKSKIRKQDTLARLSGNRFAILMEYCNLAEAQRVVEHIRQSLDRFEFKWQDKQFSTSTSIGIVPINSQSGSLIDILARADLACDAAKEAGGNRIHVDTEDDIAVGQRHEEMRWVERINLALREDRFMLYFQPIVGLNNNLGDRHYELLIRMVDGDGKLIPPGAFLPAAERYKLSSKLDRWVIRYTLDWLETNTAFLDEHHCWGINLSGQSLADEGLLDFVVREMELRNIPPRNIYFEITETSAIANLKNAIRFISGMKDHGVRFALDDFGSGLSSFAYLRNIPVDYLKIDGIFVKEIVHNDMDFTMVKAIHDVGKAMGKQTIAEFVEDETIIARLRQIGVDYAQGFGICKPMPLQEFHSLNLEHPVSKQIQEP